MKRPHFPRILATFLLILATFCGVTLAHADWKESREAGRKALATGNLDAAEDRMKEAIVAAKKLGPDHQPELVEAFVGLSDVYLKQARMTEANLLLEQSLLLLAQTPGADSRVLDQIYNNLATVRIFQKNPAEAESLLKRALANREKRLGREHVELANVLDRLADLAEEQKNGEDSLALHERALAIREQALGPDNSDTIAVVQYLAAGYALGEDWARAVPLYERILRAWEKTIGPEQPDLKGPLSVLAGAAMIQHRFRDAITLLKRLVAIQAAEEAKVPKADLSLPHVTPYFGSDADEVDRVEPRDFASQLRKAIRLADLEHTPDAFPTEADLAFLKSERWCPTVSDLAGLEELTSVVLENKRVDNAALAHLRGLVSLRILVVNRGQPINTEPKIDDAGLAHLRNLTGLKKLDLWATAIRGPGLSALAKMNELRWLNRF